MNQEKILFVNACVRPESRTREMAESLLAELKGTVSELKLYEEGIPPLDLEALERRTQLLSDGNIAHPDFRYARRFAEADVIVIAAPYWDLLFPAVLRCYLEAVTVTGITFSYTDQGVPVGMCKAKRLYYVAAAGGYIGENNFGYLYIRALAQGFYGINDVRLLSAEGLDVYGNDPQAILADAKASAAGLCK